MRLSVVAGLLCLVSFSAAATADELYCDGRRLSVTVTGVADGQLTYLLQDKSDARDLAQIDRIVISNFVSFNQAEQLLAAKRYGQAVQKYAAALKLAKEDWQKTLIEKRSDLAVLRSPPVATPATAPATRPARAARQPDKSAALASMAALAKDLSTAPADPRTKPTWNSMPKYDQETVAKDHEKALADWKKAHSFSGSKVTWRVKLAGLQTEGDKTTLRAQGGKDLIVQGPVTPTAALKSLPKDRELIVSGTIKDYTFEMKSADTIFDIESLKLSVTLQDVTVNVAPPETPTKPAKKQERQQERMK